MALTGLGVRRNLFFFLGLSGWSRILNVFQVPTRFVWQLPDSVFGEICFILGPSGWAHILTVFQVPIRFVGNYRTRCSAKFVLF